MAPKQTERSHTPIAAKTVHASHQRITPKAEVAPVQPVAAVSVDDAPAPLTQSGEFVLPSAVISRSDIGKSIREIEKINDYFHQAGLRGSKDQPLPTLGRTLESLATANGLNLIHAEDRDKLLSFLNKIKVKAPAVHMSFPSEASDDFIAKLLEWFRSEVHPHVVLNVGLQPELAAGCTLRTTNKFYDFSFRKRFDKSKEKLMLALEALDVEAGPLPAGPTSTAESTPSAASTEPIAVATATTDNGPVEAPAEESPAAGVGL